MVYKNKFMMLWRLVPVGLLISQQSLGKGHHRDIIMNFDPATMVPLVLSEKNDPKNDTSKNSEEGKWNVERVALLKQFRDLNDQLATQKLFNTEKTSLQQKKVDDLSSLIDSLKQEMLLKSAEGNSYITEECGDMKLPLFTWAMILTESSQWLWQIALFLCALIVALCGYCLSGTAREIKMAPSIAHLTCAPVSYNPLDGEQSASFGRSNNSSITLAAAESDRELLAAVREKCNKLVKSEEISKAAIVQLKEQLSATNNEVASLASLKLLNATEMATLEGRIESENKRANELIKERDELKISITGLTTTSEKLKSEAESSKKPLKILTKDRDDLAVKCSALETSVTTHLSAAKAATVRIAELEKAVGDYKEKNIQDQLLLASIRDQRDDLLKSQLSNEKKLLELTGQLEVMGAEVESVKEAKLISELKIIELEECIKNENLRVENLLEEKNQLMVSKEALEVTYAKQSTWAEGSKKLLQELQSDRDKLHKKSLGLEVVVRGLKIESETKITDLEKQLSIQGIKKAETDRELLVLLHEKRDELVMTDEISNIYIQLRKKNAELAGITSQKADSDTRLAEMERRVMREQSLTEGIVGERDQLMASVATLEAQCAKQSTSTAIEMKLISDLRKERDDLMASKKSAEANIEELKELLQVEKAHHKRILLEQEVRDVENRKNLQFLQASSSGNGSTAVSAGQLQNQVGELEAQRDRLRVKAAHARFGLRQENVLTHNVSVRRRSSSAFDLYTSASHESNDLDDAGDGDFDLSDDSDSDQSGNHLGIFTETNKDLLSRENSVSRLIENDEKSIVTPPSNILKESTSRVVLGVQQDGVTEPDRTEKLKSRVPRHAFTDMDTVTVSGDEDENINSVNIDRAVSSSTSTPEKTESGAHQVTPDKPVFPSFSSLFFNTPV